MPRCGCPPGGHYRPETYRKVRVADVVDISALSASAAGNYALQAHFDNCVSDEDQLPGFVIEFDGGGHDPRHDEKKDTSAVAAKLRGLANQACRFGYRCLHTLPRREASHTRALTSI